MMGPIKNFERYIEALMNPPDEEEHRMPKRLEPIKKVIQSCAYQFGQPLFQDSEETIHSAEKSDTSYKQAGFFTEMKQKKFQNGRLRKFKMAASKKPHFPAPPILNIFS